MALVRLAGFCYAGWLLLGCHDFYYTDWLLLGMFALVMQAGWLLYRWVAFKVMAGCYQAARLLLDWLAVVRLAFYCSVVGFCYAGWLL